MNLFFGTVTSDGTAVLSEEESLHCIRVLRMTTGGEIRFTDGEGNLYAGIILEADPKQCRIKITNTQSSYNKRNYSLHIAIAPTKSMDRFEWFLEKATEIGINEITPMICRHSERKVLKTERLKKVVLSAMKQSGQAFLPTLNELMPFEKVIQTKGIEQRFICTAGSHDGLSRVSIKSKSILLLIGPEGDFSEQEMESAKEKLFHTVHLGPNRLRTETAGVVACSIVSLLNQNG